MKVSPELPDPASLTQLDHDYLKTVLVATLRHPVKLSKHEACVALGVTRRAFKELLLRFGFSVLADDQVTIDVERHA